MRLSRYMAVILCLILTLSAGTVGFAKDAPQSKGEAGTEPADGRSQAEKEGVLELSIEDAVRLGINNSIALKQVQNQIDISDLNLDRARYQSKKLKDADKRISEGREELSQAQSVLNMGYAPVDVTLPDGTVIKKGTNINSLPLPEDMKKQIIEGIQSQIDSARKELEQGISKIDSALEEAGAEFSEKLNFESLKSLDINSTRDIMTTMAEVSDEVTRASYDIYKNQVALLIQKSYYDVLKAKKMLEVKDKAVKRAQEQFNLTKESYEKGMKAKDDMLLAELYYKKTQIEYRQAQENLNNAFTELKKNLNVPQDTVIELKDALAEEPQQEDLEQGLLSGMKNRLEIKQAFGQVIVYNLNFEATKKTYPENTFQYREAKLLKEKAELNLEKARLDVESSIRQSYETMQSAADMLKTARSMVEEAKEVVDIARFKYNEGYGIENSLLKKLDLESASGTIVEVLAAEENLADVEEKVVEITYGYNLARMKYYNDIGKFRY
ncbi:TolC family protein [Thermoanaerobacterium sp. DL9XJH110]|uniref:TolC family protein n=1 Tax=Thermoanaerobacterium sp. DL9XJH110 TaxID=3386643 RepID=UPI003BB6AF33